MMTALKSIVAKLSPRVSGPATAVVPDKRIKIAGKLSVRAHLILMPMVFIPWVSYWLIGPTYFHHLPTFILASLLNYSMTLCCVLTLDNLTARVLLRYPNLNQSLERAFHTFLVFFFVTPSFLLFGIFIYSYFHLFGYEHTPGLTLRILLYNVGVNLLSTGIDETVYSLRKWKENALEREQLQKVNLQSQYESLKHQVNPHFLFNSLNSLSSLIADEPEQAELFVDEMAKVYRYLLQSNGKQSGSLSGSELTTLEAELDFIESYFHLLKTRYRTGIELTIEVSQTHRSHKLPPLALQMLVENAVKHNVVSAKHPLLLEIFVEEGPFPNLLVRNNLQPKSGFSANGLGYRLETSNGVGLTNIKTKYRLLNRTATGTGLHEPLISRDDKYFTVVLPLFSPLTV